MIVAVPDGGDTISQVNYKQALRAAQESEAIIYSVIVPIEASAGRDTGGEHALIQFSEDTGGKYYYASSLPELEEAFKKISDELRMQYLLGYYPSQHESPNDFPHSDRPGQPSGRRPIPGTLPGGVLHHAGLVLSSPFRTSQLSVPSAGISLFVL